MKAAPSGHVIPEALAPASPSVASPTNAGAPARRRQRALSWIGAAILVVWVVWFGVCLLQKPLPRAVPQQQDYYEDRITYIPTEPLIGVDFHHNYSAARTWLRGGNPYTALNGDPANAVYVYPPLTLVAFAWTGLFPARQEMPKSDWAGTERKYFTSEPAILVWSAAILGILGLATWRSQSARAALQLEPLPLTAMVAAVLASYPVLFELERGNCDVLPLLAIIGVVAALGWRRRHAGDMSMGFLAAAAIGIKPYAIVLLPALVTLRRWRAALYTLSWLALEALVFRSELRAWAAIAARKNKTEWHNYMDCSHTIVGLWHRFWPDVGAPWLAKLPAQTTMLFLLVACASVVGWKVFRRRVNAALAWSYLLWLTALGTMISPYTYDYNLLFVPLLALAVWSPRDSWRVQACVWLLLPWCQPFFFGLIDLPLLLLKVVTVLLLGIVILRRLDDTPPSASV